MAKCKATYFSILSILLLNPLNAQTGDGCFLKTCPQPGQVRIDAIVNRNGEFAGGCNCGCPPGLADSTSPMFCAEPKTVNYNPDTLLGDCSCQCNAAPSDCVFPQVYQPTECACGCPMFAPDPSSCRLPLIWRQELCQCACEHGSVGGPCIANGKPVPDSVVLPDCQCDASNIYCEGNTEPDPVTGECKCPQRSITGAFFPTCELPLRQDPYTCDCVTTTTTLPPVGPVEVVCSDTGDCKCPYGTQGLCTITCDGTTDACKDGVIECNNDGFDCVINCLSGSGCAGSAKIVGPIDGALQVNCIGGQSCEGSVLFDASLGTDLIVVCDGSQSCKGSVEWMFGRGKGAVACNGAPDACTGGANFRLLPNADTIPGASFECTGQNCPDWPKAFSNAPPPTAQTINIGYTPVVPGPSFGGHSGTVEPIYRQTIPPGLLTQPPLFTQAPINQPWTQPPVNPWTQPPVNPWTPPPMNPQPTPPVNTLPFPIYGQTTPPVQTTIAPVYPQPAPVYPIPGLPVLNPGNPGTGTGTAPGAQPGGGGNTIISPNAPIAVLAAPEIVICEGERATCSCSGNQACTIKCEAEQCKESTLNCADGFDCNVVCTDIACQTSTINGPNGGSLVVECHEGSCTNTVFNANHALDVTYQCTGKDACKGGGTHLNCGSRHCSVSCPGEAACDAAEINPGTPKALSFACSGPDANCPVTYSLPPAPVPTPPPTERCAYLGPCPCTHLNCFANRDPNSCRCECPFEVLLKEARGDPQICGAEATHQIYHSSSCSCDCPPNSQPIGGCRVGQSFNQNTCQCQCPGGNDCPGDSVMNVETCQCECPAHTPTASDCAAIGKTLRHCACDCPFLCAGAGQIQDPYTCACACPYGTPVASTCESGIIDHLACQCAPPIPSTFCCHTSTPDFKPWQGRCWDEQSEESCLLEPNNRCVWDATNCHSNPPANSLRPGLPCIMRDEMCGSDEECCSEVCKVDGICR